MPANPSLIDAVECAILRDLYEVECGVRPSDEVIVQIRAMEGASIWHRKVKAAARAALQALLEAGPTEAMVRAAVECRHGPATYKAVSKPGTDAYEEEARDDFAAMLRAALEETGNV